MEQHEQRILQVLIQYRKQIKCWPINAYKGRTKAAVERSEEELHGNTQIHTYALCRRDKIFESG